MATTRPSSRVNPLSRVEHDWTGYSIWVLAAGALGFAVPAVFSGLLEMPRNWFLIPYFAIMMPFLFGYVRWAGIDVGQAIRYRWIWGIAGGGVIGAFMVMNILNNETASP